jgi:peptidoglycan/LPS O-acetylase OafA/YrhL
MLVAALAWTPPVLHRGIWELFCVFVLFPGILAAGIRLELPEIIARPFTFLGAISYAVYAIHGPLIIVVNKISEHLGLGEWPAIALYIAVLIMGAQTVVVLFDGPVRKAINSWRRQRQVAAG